ncbi:MAG TPA: phosphatase PAP2 family protein [Chitinophagaceae bacterium]|nr:phosphatase PAP2 family protein [Chitinophagaceae bacterium]
MWRKYLWAFAPFAFKVSAQSDSLPQPVPHDTVSTADIQPVYKLKPKTDLPIMAVGSAWSLYAFTKIYSKDTSTRAQILALDKDNIPGFDRWATKYYSEQTYHSGDELFYGAMPLPLVVGLIDGKIRKDYFKMAYLYWQTMSITGLLYTGSTYFTNRYRPYAYNPEVPMSARQRGGAKNSFFAGHVALVASSTFFTASVLDHYHPDSKLRWVYYAVAGAATATVAYKRLRAGQHFPSDILLGIAQGTLTGLLVPRVHRVKPDPRLSIFAVPGEKSTLTVVYRF